MAHRAAARARNYCLLLPAAGMLTLPAGSCEVVEEQLEEVVVVTVSVLVVWAVVCVL